LLFNSPEFLFVFLPLTLLMTACALAWRGRTAGVLLLTLASLVFYGWWEAQALLIIGASIALNFTLSRAIAAAPRGTVSRKWYLSVGIVANLAALGFFKYADFLVVNVAELTGLQAAPLGVVLPLAISFYSFQQIAFLVDTYNAKMERIPFRDYMISVVFFPHLIAGPLLHYRDIIGQFESRFSVSWATISAGMPIFAMGLAKKVAIADPIAQFVTPLFDQAAVAPLSLFDAWAAALGYTAQLYFDFSGYSDMAIGLGLMYGITLPLNFFSPYKSTSIVEFWRRWHMTLSSFLRDYLYIPLGGSRVGPVRRYGNLMIVMVLGGLWHGAGWTFVFWGFLHGSYLVVNHLWRNQVSPYLGAIDKLLLPVYASLTFVLVVVAWVFFRAPTFDVALNVLSGMFAPETVALPGELMTIGALAAIPGIAWGGQGMAYPDFVAFWTYAAVACVLAWGAPNSAQIFGLAGDGATIWRDWWSPAHWVAGVVLLWAACFGIFSAVPSEFLYFQF